MDDEVAVQVSIVDYPISINKMSTTTFEEKEIIGEVTFIRYRISGTSVFFRVKPDNNDKLYEADIYNNQAEIDRALDYVQGLDAAPRLTTAEQYNRWVANLSVAHNNSPDVKVKVTLSAETVFPVVTNVELVERTLMINRDLTIHKPAKKTASIHEDEKKDT